MLHFYKLFYSEADSLTGINHIYTIYIGVIFSIFGLLGNLVSIAVWKRINRKRCNDRKSAGVYLITLNVTDSCLLVLFLSTEALQELMPSLIHGSYHGSYTFFYTHVGIPLFYWFFCTSVWIVVFLTLNRFIAVLFPLRSKRLNSLTNTYIIISVLFFLSLVLNIPRFYNYQISFISNSSVHEMFNQTQIKSFHSYEFGVQCMFLLFSPFLIISVLNSLIILKLCQKTGVGERSKRLLLSQEKKTTLILMTVSISFLIFLMWQCASQCFWIIELESNDSNDSKTYDLFHQFGILGIVINSSNNFILYCVSGMEFRKELYAIFKKQFKSTDKIGSNNTLNIFREKLNTSDGILSKP
ncbi:proteinase-activated receptor 1-like [Hydra vulgaris]|uniref:Proteinase-activated receptor 1-like n=1 Tax=Hydra vulgaris TaxID=6087 RepID=A0ABM4BMB2_HYDVU